MFGWNFLLFIKNFTPRVRRAWCRLLCNYIRSFGINQCQFLEVDLQRPVGRCNNFTPYRQRWCHTHYRQKKLDYQEYKESTYKAYYDPDIDEQFRWVYAWDACNQRMAFSYKYMLYNDVGHIRMIISLYETAQRLRAVQPALNYYNENDIEFMMDAVEEDVPMDEGFVDVEQNQVNDLDAVEEDVPIDEGLIDVEQNYGNDQDMVSLVSHNESESIH